MRLAPIETENPQHPALPRSGLAALLRLYVGIFDIPMKNLQQQLKVSRPTVATYLLGTRWPKWEQFKPLAKMLNLTPDELEKFAKAFEQIDPQELQQRYHQMFRRFAKEIYCEAVKNQQARGARSGDGAG